ncbi:hypothetical protein SAMN04515692_1173 [Leifsonia sp. CL147]|nr:hypothetical protein SAMN04515694_12925 [Leifsonia sp. CL154]SFL91040.1 hypothetical protein SAMN04515692_1173 [Leifsonia sp. CL147]
MTGRHAPEQGPAVARDAVSQVYAAAIHPKLRDGSATQPAGGRSRGVAMSRVL